ncbi:hypothetical protein DPMN_147516 [Dreissena polymorpha]|uniref:Uncharacterized protein n=1 Tax=Dreissena polymorpha TaxID=45954 RepID=A0A9D4F8G4_DREPO|nr:hypothetical protein DPMN_147516 [Dreissena polymorpha]
MMELLVNNPLSLVIAAVAMAILILTSAELVPSMDRVAPKYFKLVTFSSLSHGDICTCAGHAVHPP